MKPERPAVLVVSKPLGPPWNDGSKNLAGELARALVSLPTPREVHAFGPSPLEGILTHRVPSARLGRRTTLSMIATLATEHRAALWHFVFAPNARTSRAARSLSALRRRPTIQTLASMPASDVRLGDVVFGDRVVALSRAALARARAEGVAEERLALVPIAITPPPTPSPAEVARVIEAHDLASRFVVTFPGDLEHGRGADVIVEACGAMAHRADAILVLACRDKTPRARARREELEARARRASISLRVVGETPSIHALLAASDLVALPTDTLYAKVDHPLVLLEAMHLGRAVLVSEGTSAHELAEDGAAIGCPLDPGAIAAALDRLVTDRALSTSWGARARACVQGRRVEVMAQRYDSIYDELLR
ncbi:MAG: glycosyltransferase [Sandaracinaceae bacterium]|nr:glycosyltransferase [Sandaracinaceae bacterium]